MLRQELVEGYVRGDVTRRTFVRRLTVTGVSLAAALSYADLLRPQAAHAAAGEDDYYEDDLYPDREAKLPPDVITESPVAIGATTATARALIDPNRQDTQVWFEVTPQGGATIVSRTATESGDVDRRVEIALSGLAPQTTYTVRAVAENGSGKTAGEPFAFTTTAKTEPPAPAPAAPVAAAAAVTPVAPADTRGPFVNPGKVTATLRQVVRTRVLPVPLTTDEDATVDLVATLNQPVKGVRAALSRTRKVTVASGRVAVRGGRSTTARLKVTRAGARALKGRKAATLQLEVRSVDRARNRSLLRAGVKLK